MTDPAVGQKLDHEDGHEPLYAADQRVGRKVGNLAHAVSLHLMHYNFARPHWTLRERYPRTPAMAAGDADHTWSLEDIAALLD